MHRYIIKPLLLMIPSLLIVSFIIFSLARMIPGDVVDMMFEDQGYAQDRDEMRRKLGIDKPIPIQYIEWLARMMSGDLGVSLWTKQPVLDEILARLPVSMELGLMTISFALLMAVPIGILSAVRQDTTQDIAARSFAIGGLSIPGFWLGTLVVVLPSIWWGWTPPIQYVAFAQNPWGHLGQFLLPAVILSFASAASIMRLTRAQMLEVLRQDYVRTAWSKGLQEKVVILKHALKNAIIPVVTIIGLQIANVAGGTVVMEQIFGLPGMGRFLIEAITQRDYPVIQGVNFTLASVIIVMNLVVDLIYGFLDPRIRYS
ncbi:MAG: peptide ABC transporter [Candidatus Entotheonella gemina]|uniref:Peptide ABC transporter n=1 Tax=Candidatus Entotheonella gemina TaxID=1429439 RepID=W4LX90_9BACT|nr:MAG: peptide ABC transporter [Candidatus Entotheonella gemina]